MASLRPDHRVSLPIMTGNWLTAVFVHWPCPPEAIQERLPPGLHVDEYDGSAWLSIAPFVMWGSRPLGRSFPPGLHRVPGLSALQRFATPADHRGTNLRTYVRGPDGRDGLWFLGLDTSNIAVAVGGRTLLGAPYHWSRVSVHRRDDTVIYSGVRWGAQARYELALRPGEPIAPTDLDIWLTGRWRAYSRHAGRLLVTPVEHEPWPLRTARLQRLEQTLTDAVGLAGPAEPVVHFSDGVHQVRTGVTRPL